MKSSTTYVFLLITLLIVAGTQRSQAEDKIDFARDVRPILSDKCFHCHGPDEENRESLFRVDTREGLYEDLGGYFGVVPGDPAESELVKRIHSDDESEVMPPADSNRSLSDEQKQVLKSWIEQGAEYAGHWAFQRVERPTVPDQDAQPIDALVLKRLGREGLKLSPRADPATLLRRASLTLTGQLPPPKLQEEFLANPTESAYARAVNQLLGSKHYAERQALRWLDAARYADTDGYQVDRERTNWPWRDWVIKAFDENMPFDQFTIEQLAGDMLENASDLQRLATAFNRNHRQNAEAGALAEEFRVENVIDRVETTATVWLGLTMGCARCHDHKYDPLSQREFYQLYAYFNNIGEKGIGRGQDANPTMVSFSPLSHLPEDLLNDLNEKEAALAEARKGLKKRETEWLAKVEAAISAEDSADDGESAERMPAAADEEPKANQSPLLVELDDKLIKILQKPAKDRSAQEKRTIATQFESIDPSYAAAHSAFAASEKAISKVAGPRVTVMVMHERDGDGEPAYLLNRGAYDQPDKTEALPRGVPAALLSVDAEKVPSDRLEFARWLVSRDNPLTARVIVNRIWQDHFGTGLVKTTEDFGVQGEVPVHPDLLDWLSAEFMESGWDIKALHRQIVTSDTYCQQSQTSAELQQRDPKNRLLARGPRYRADGFVIRDIALQASGLLNEEVGGPPVKPYQPDGLWETLAANAGTRYQPSKGTDLYRKSMYTYWKRAVNPPRQIIFDGGGREVCNVRVRRTNTPLQALALLNDPTMIEAARALAQRSYLAGGDTSTILRRMYITALAREPKSTTAEVLERNYDYFRDYYTERPEEAAELVSIGESVRDEQIDTVEHAALTSAAHLILNLDEFINVE